MRNQIHCNEVAKPQGCRSLLGGTWPVKLTGPPFILQISYPSACNGVEIQLESNTLSESSLTDQEKVKMNSPQTEEPKVSGEASSSIANVAADKATKGALWLQKSSWTQLVGDSNGSAFSITQILRNVTSEKHDSQPPPIGIDVSISKNKKRQKVSQPQEGTRTNVVDAHSNPTVNSLANKGHDYGEQSTENIDIQMGRSNNGASLSSPGKKQPSASKIERSDVDETFTFVRTAAFMKEWMRCKAALSRGI